MVNFEVKGIGLTTEIARTKPQDRVVVATAELSGKTAGKLFVGIDDIDPSTPNAFGLFFNGKQVDVNDNETYMQTNTAKEPKSGWKTYAFDVPMRYLTNDPKPATYTIQFLLGTLKDEVFTLESTSKVYILEVPQDEIRTGEVTPE